MKERLLALVERYRKSPEFLLVEIKDVNQPGMTGDTLLHAAAVRGGLDDVQLLISAGAHVNAVGDLGNTPLHYAASRGFTDIVQTLLKSGADCNRNEFGETASDLAKLKRHFDVAQILKALQ